MKIVAKRENNFFHLFRHYGRVKWGGGVAYLNFWSHHFFFRDESFHVSKYSWKMVIVSGRLIIVSENQTKYECWSSEGEGWNEFRYSWNVAASRTRWWRLWFLRGFLFFLDFSFLPRVEGGSVLTLVFFSPTVWDVESKAEKSLCAGYMLLILPWNSRVCVCVCGRRGSEENEEECWSILAVYRWANACNTLRIGTMRYMSSV